MFIVYFHNKSNPPCVLIRTGNKVIDINIENRCLAVEVVLQDKWNIITVPLSCYCVLTVISGRNYCLYFTMSLCSLGGSLMHIFACSAINQCGKVGMAVDGMGVAK